VGSSDGCGIAPPTTDVHPSSQYRHKINVLTVTNITETSLNVAASFRLSVSCTPEFG
jgi:hypothetical protein